MAKNPHLAWHNKRTPSVKEMNALSKFEKQYRSVSAEDLDIINKYQIFATKSQTYQWLTEQVFTFGVGIRHIGEYDRYNCQKAIEVLIKCLQNNIWKMPNGFRYYKGDQGNSYSMELGYTGIER